MNERPWLRSIGWLLFLGPFFFATYYFANFAASQRASVPVVMFSWERYIPLIAWTILPYWSTDLLYPLSLLICRTRGEVDLQGKRLFAMQVFAIACFLLFPLRCSFESPSVAGWERAWFAALHTFDRPFNQAPSLHAGLAVILWMRFRADTHGVPRLALAAWCVLMAASTFTTHQHQFIDLPTGAWAGLLVVAAFPEHRKTSPHIRLTLLYLAGAITCVTAAFLFQGFAWVLLWPGFALSMVAAAYWSGNPQWLKMGLLMLPYTVAAWINSRCWTRGESARTHLAGGVWIGRAPLPWERAGMKSFVDLAPELRLSADEHVDILDLTVPACEQLDQAVQAIIRLANGRPTLVCCALGYSRSAIVSAAWLIASGHATSTEEAIAQVRRVRPKVVLRDAHRMRLNEWTMHFTA